MKLSRVVCIVLIVACAQFGAFASGQVGKPAASGKPATADQFKTIGDMRAAVFLAVYATPAEYKKATGKNVGAYKQSPMLDALVASKALPPVKDRLPREPFVVKPDREIGKYGGTMNIPDLWGDINGDYMDENLTDCPPNVEVQWRAS